MSETRNCGRCGKELSADAPGGLCPECLFKVGLESQSQEPVGQSDEAAAPTASYGGNVDAAAKDDTVVLAPGQQFGGYHIVGRLGSGGMGTVYEADHLESGRRVALKVLDHRFDSPEAKKRFLREGRLAAAVNHPNSVYVFGTEEVAGVPVIAMELVPCGTLEERVLQGGPMPIGEAVDAILQVVNGLEAAEAGGVLHRDVKAANCFVDREGTVKVGDFGLSISTSLRGDSNVTADGTFLGTPAFSSPEQLRGDELDIRSDIYAVGVTLYYLLTGRMPFKADNMIRLIAVVLEHPPASPSDLRPEIPKGLARAVLRCLQKQPSARFKQYDELRQALAPYSSAAPTPARLGLRLGAGIVDSILFAPVASCITLSWVGGFERMSDPKFFGSPDQVLLLAVGALLNTLYFALPEGIWGASPGKAICGVRVADPRRNAPGVRRTLVRAAVYVLFPQSVILVGVGLISTGVISTAPEWLHHLLAYSSFAMLALMFSTARQRNGYAGFQDLLSDTRVVSKSVYQARPVQPVVEQPPEDTSATPRIGPYHVLQSMGKTDGRELVLGYDRRLLRKVWIRAVRDDEPAVAAETRELGRPGRLRWLAGRRQPGECWDAYEAPSGSPLVDLLKKPQPWERVRYWLVDLAWELAVGAKEQSLPAVLALDRVWITSEGRAKLLDFSAPGAQEHGPWSGLSPLAGDDPASTRLFLNQVAVAALEGRAVEPEEAGSRAVAAPLPLHAKRVLDELPRIEGPEYFARQLKPLLNRTAAVSRVRRFGVLAVCLAPLFFFTGVFALGLLMTERWLDEHPDVAPLHQCLMRMEQLERASDPADGDQEEQRRFLEVYIAGRFGRAISDRSVWSGPFSESFFTPNQRMIAERAVATHPNPSEERVADAAARLQPFLDEMSDGLSGLLGGAIPLPFWVVGFAAGNFLVLVVVPSVICALLFRGGLLMYIFGIAIVTKSGSRASRLRTLCRSLVTWSPCVLWPMLIMFLAGLLGGLGLAITWSLHLSLYLSLAVFVGLIAWSLSMPVRSIPDRIAGTYPVPR